jgi:DNA-binding CsgD family transcriptional regulator/molybdopterin converting factor small subunit
MSSESPVRVTVRLFAALRERAGAGKRELELPQGATAGDVFAALDIGAEPPGLSYAVNREYAERSVPLQDGDEVALITPVSGGADEPLVLLGPEPIDLNRLIAHVSGPDAGAIATFTGTVRETARERQVLDLLSAGSDQEKIAQELFISPKTVATHIQRILTKLGVHNRTQAVALALRDDRA